MKPIIIQGAESSEIDYLVEKLENKEEILIGKYLFFKGNYEKKEVIISKTKVGEINSASATTIAILKFSPKCIINQGTSGGHGKNIHKGDLIIGEKYIQINSFFSNYLEEGKGSNIENWVIQEYKSEDDINSNYNYANKDLLKLAKNLIPNISKNPVHIGIIGSGDMWNREIDRILYLNEKYETLCEDMETAGVYKVSNSFNVPAISIRIVSNNEILKEEYEPSIARKCQEIIYEFIKRIDLKE